MTHTLRVICNISQYKLKHRIFSLKVFSLISKYYCNLLMNSISTIERKTGIRYLYIIVSFLPLIYTW